LPGQVPTDIPCASLRVAPRLSPVCSGSRARSGPTARGPNSRAPRVAASECSGATPHSCSRPRTWCGTKRCGRALTAVSSLLSADRRALACSTGADLVNLGPSRGVRARTAPTEHWSGLMCLPHWSGLMCLCSAVCCLSPLSYWSVVVVVRRGRRN